MQGIAYITSKGNPRLTWPAETTTDILDADGMPTGKTETTNNLQELVAALPPGTEYTLVTEEEAEGWWQAHIPAREKIISAISALEARQTPRMLRGAALGNPEDVERIANIEAEITELRKHVANGGEE